MTDKILKIFNKKHNSCTYFNYSLYHQHYGKQHKLEYDVSEFTHPIYAKIVDTYNQSPWHRIKQFKLKNNPQIYTVDNIKIVWDGGYVLKLNYSYFDNKHKQILKYKYIKNINSLKYLRLLHLREIDIVVS